MAKVPTKVSATAGQGTSRRSYQVARSLGMRGTGTPPGGVRAPRALNPPPAGIGGGGRASGVQMYAKNVDASPFGGYTANEMPNPNLKSLQSLPTNPVKPKKGFVF